jgi:predicted component of type VI protein secretion system
MDSWIYIFSKFTPEALVLELAFIFILFGIYSIFWILRKRRYGVADQTLPSGPVKAYLNELIGAADHLRVQLFGLLPGNIREGESQQAVSSGDNSEIGRILSKLETKLDAQGRAIEHLSLGGPLVAGGPAVPAFEPSLGGGGGPVDEAEVNSLKVKVDSLETRLAEYSIIEDDLANLKKIQQENVELRAALEALTGGRPLPPVAAAPLPKTVAEPVVAAPAEPVLINPTPTPTPAAAPPPPAVAEAKEAAPAPADSAAQAAPREAVDMGEDDLVKEFEKMLQG